MGLLRLLLALSVVLAHAGTYHGFELVGGKTAVETFFIISGFYMALVLTEKYGTAAEPGRQRAMFYQARILRLYPLYAIVLVGSLAVDDTVRHRWEHLFATGGGPFGLGGLTFLITSNVVIFGQDIATFLGAHPDGGVYVAHSIATQQVPMYPYLIVIQAWSLSLELTFYVMAPWLVRRSTRTIAALALASLAFRTAIWAAGLRDDPWSYRLLPSELVFFFSGVLVYRVYRHYRNRPLPKPASVAALGLLVAVMAAYFWLPETGKATVFYLLAASLTPVIFHLTRSSRIDRILGDLSYPLYIVHTTVVGYIFVRWGVRPILSSVASVAIALLLLVVFDRPFERWRQRRIGRLAREALIPEPVPY
jgi:peptidoglycan/LPS O-acetylase OafA/YrhL